MLYEQTVRDALARAQRTGCTGFALELHVAEELGCNDMTHQQLQLIKPDFERIVWPVTRPKSTRDDQARLF